MTPSLVSGDVEGKFQLLFSRVQNVLKKSGEFEVRTIAHCHIIQFITVAKPCSFRGGLLPMMSQLSCVYSKKLSKGMGYRSTLGIVSTMLKLSTWSQLLLDDQLTFNQQFYSC